MSITSNTGVSLFTNYDMDASSGYVYNEDGEYAADTGWTSARSDNIAVSVCVATLTASSLYYRIEGRTKSYTRPVEIYSKTKTAVDSIDQLINICEPLDEIRVGVRTDCAATVAFYSGVIKEGVK